MSSVELAHRIPIGEVMTAQSNLPAPTKNAFSVIDTCGAIVFDILSLVIPTNTLSNVLLKYKEKKLKAGQEILLCELRKGNIEILNDEQYSVFIPGAYQFFEAARYGEYEHNLRLLAKLLTVELCNSVPDSGKTARNRRRLEFLSLPALHALAAAHRAFENAKASPEFDGFHQFITASELVRAMGMEFISPAVEANSYLVDFLARGLLFIGGNPNTIGGQYYYKTSAFDEIIVSAKDSLGESSPDK